MPGRHLAALLAASGMATAMLVGPPSASAGCTIVDYTPHSVVIGLSPVIKTFGVATSGCTVTGWSVDIRAAGVFVYDGAPQDVFYPDEFYNSDAGVKADAVLEADDETGTVSRTLLDSFVVKRRTTWTAFNASPEPVTKGRPIRITGTLKVADWNAMKYVPLKGSTVSVQFKRAGTTTYSTVKKVTTSSTYGTVSTTVTARYDGTWRLVYAGSGTRGGATSATDYVDVR